MSKLYDKNDPNQLKEDQAPYGDEAGNDSSAAAIHGRVVRLETNAKHVATNEGLARVEGKVDEAKAELKGEIKSGNAKLKGEIDTGKAETDTKFAKVYAKLGLVEKLLYANHHTSCFRDYQRQPNHIRTLRPTARQNFAISRQKPIWFINKPAKKPAQNIGRGFHLTATHPNPPLTTPTNSHTIAAVINAVLRRLWSLRSILGGIPMKPFAKTLLALALAFAAQTALAETPLINAVRAGSWDKATWLIKNGANVNQADRNGNTPLHWAAALNTKLIGTLIRQGADFRATNNQGYTPLHSAAYGNAPRAVVVLLRYGADIQARDLQGFSPLHVAASVNTANTALVLIRNRADVNARDKKGHTPLHVAASVNALPSVDVLLRYRADINARDSNGYIPLHSAAYFNAIDVAERLLKRGADIDAITDGPGFTPLHASAFTNAAETADLLIDHGAYLLATTSPKTFKLPSGEEFASATPLDLAKLAKSWRTVKVFERAEAKHRRKQARRARK